MSDKNLFCTYVWYLTYVNSTDIYGLNENNLNAVLRYWYCTVVEKKTLLNFDLFWSTSTVPVVPVPVLVC